MATFQAMKRKQEEDSRDHPAKRARTEPEFELYHEVTGILKKYRYTPALNIGVLALFSMVWGQLIALMEEELNQHQYKASLVLNLELVKNSPSGVLTATEAYFRSNVMTILSAHVIELAAQKAFSEIQNRIDKWTNQGSGWTVNQIKGVYLEIAKYTPVKVGSYIDLPKYLKRKEAIVNVKNQDQQCLKWALLSALHPVEHGSHPDRVSKYRPYENELDFTGIDFPTPLNQIPNVEHQNNLSINVFGYTESAGVHPLYLTKDLDKSPINLMLITKVEDGKILSHYCWIKDFNRLCFNQTRHKERKHFCTRCISPHSSERTLQDHLIYCRGVDAAPCHAVFPQATEDGSPPTIQFKNIQHLMKAPYVVYADTESVIQPVDSPNTNTNTVHTSTHIPCSFSYVVVRSDGKVISEKLYRGEDCMDVFFQQLEDELEEIRKDLKNARPLEMTKEEQEAHNNTGKCWICDGPFRSYKDGDCHGLWKVKDHDHITGEYRGPAHSKCNQQLRIDPFRTPIPVFFHNLKNYDSHHLISAIGRTEEKTTICTDKNGQAIIGKDKPVTVTEGKISAIVQNMEKLISFSWGQFRFVDSFAFLNSSLDKLVQNTPKKDLRITRQQYPNRCYLSQSRRLLNDTKFHLVTQKGVYPYEYMDSLDRFDDKELPTQVIH